MTRELYVNTKATNTGGFPTDLLCLIDPVMENRIESLGFYLERDLCMHRILRRWRAHRCDACEMNAMKLNL